jgi:hypothetical protein
MRRYERKTFGARRVSSNQGDTMQQSQRNQAVQKFLDDYRSGPVPSLDKLSTDLRLIPASANSTKGTCTVCGVLLLGRQDRLCSGHWDYIFLDEIFHTLQYIAEFVEGNLNGLHITHDAWTGHWLPLYKGALKNCGTSMVMSSSRTKFVLTTHLLKATSGSGIKLVTSLISDAGADTHQ